MADGTFSIRRRQPKASEEAAAAAKAPKKDALQALLDGDSLASKKTSAKGKSRPVGDPNELRVESKRRKRLKDYDKLLKAFKYSAALDAVLKKASCLRLFVVVHCADLTAVRPSNDSVLLDHRAGSSRCFATCSEWKR